LRFDFAAGHPAGATRTNDLQNLLFSMGGEALTAQAVIRRNAKVADASATQTANKQDGVIKLRNYAGAAL
jgi:hypothetical protein